jgi:hypothetical protein
VTPFADEKLWRERFEEGMENVPEEMRDQVREHVLKFRRKWKAAEYRRQKREREIWDS